MIEVAHLEKVLTERLIKQGYLALICGMWEIAN